MKTVIVAALLASSATAIRTVSTEAQFAEFKQTYNKKYNTAAEEEHRLAVFSENMKRAAALNHANPLATFGAGVFADMTPAEFKSYHHGEKHVTARKANANRIIISDESISLTPKQQPRKARKTAQQKCNKVDWRQKGVVTPVKDQEKLGGNGWAFSAIGNIEARWKLADPKHKMTSLSVQELVSCDECSSGDCNVENAFKWLLKKRQGRVATEKALPSSQSATPTPCPTDLDSLAVGAVITGYSRLPQDENRMASWMCEDGPLTVAVDANSWQMYMGGIVTNCLSSEVDHTVLAVGFDDTYSTPYWIIKNSWGALWGEKGYIRIQKGTNQCLVSSSAMSAETVDNFLRSPKKKHNSTNNIDRLSNVLLIKDFQDDACGGSPETDEIKLNTCFDSDGDSAYEYQCSDEDAIQLLYGLTDCSDDPTSTYYPLDTCLAHGWMTSLYQCYPAPSPTTSTTTTTQPPTTAPARGNLTQKSCKGSTCKHSCTTATYPLNMCLPQMSGGAISVTCDTYMYVHEYKTSDCSDTPNVVKERLDVCLSAGGFNSVRNHCNRN